MYEAEIRPLTFLFALCVLIALPTHSTELTQPAADAFQKYVLHTEARILNEVDDPRRFVYFDSLPDKQRESLLARIRAEEVVIEPMHTRENGVEIQVPGGLVHHWIAIGFIRGATRDQVVALAQDYPRHAQIYAPDVQRAEILSHADQQFSVYYRFYRHAIVTAIYNTEFSADYFLPNSKSSYCFARAVRIAEVQNAGNPDEKELPVGNDHGYMWRLNLYTRYLEKDNGVYIQIEFLALSRSVPTIFAWLVNPYIRSIPREYLTNYVRKTRTALSPSETHS